MPDALDHIIELMLSDDSPMTDEDWEDARQAEAAIKTGRQRFQEFVRRKLIAELKQYAQRELRDA